MNTISPNKYGLLTTRLTAVMTAAITAIALTACGGNDKPTATEKPTKAEAKEGKDKEHGDKEGLKLSAEETTRAGIKTETLKVQSMADSLTVTATIRANQDRVARIAPRIEGRVATVSAKLGDTVRAGQSLATLDSLAVGEASMTLMQAQSSQRLAEADFKRAEALNAEEIIPKREYLRAKSELERATVALRSAEDKLRLLGVAPAAGGRVQSVFPLTAPLAGIVIEKKATVGALSGPSDPLFTVADLSTVWIEASLGEAQIAKVRQGAKASVTVGAYPNELFNGRVTYIANLLDKDTRTIAARIEVDNKDGRLKPEMFATATIDVGGASTKASTEVLTVPDEAIVLLQGQPTVFVFEHGGYEQRAIELGEKLSGRTVIKSGVETGEQVVSKGAYALKARLLKSQISDTH